MSFIRKVKVGKHTYLQEVQSVWKDGKSKHKYIRTVGKVVDDTRILSGSIQDSQISNVTICGPILVLDEIAKEIGLHDLLGEYSSEILSMVYSHCIDPRSLNKMTDWFGRTELNHILGLEKLTERRLVDSFESINNDDKIDYFQEKIFASLKNHYKIEPDSFFYDVTNVYFFGTKCKIAKKGKNKNGGRKRQIQIGLGVCKQGFPILHKVFAGDVFDARTLFNISKCLPSFGLKRIFLVWDRGVTSKINIRDSKKLGFEVLCGIARKGKISNELDKTIKAGKIITPKNRVQLKNTSYYVIQQKYVYEHVSGYLYICLNRKEQINKQEKRLKNIHEAKEILKNGKTIDKNLRKYFSSNGDLLEMKLKEKEKYDGFSLLFCTKKISSEEAVIKYFEKDIVEKAFASLKGVIGLRPIRKWLAKRVKAHVFICYLSYLLLSILDYKLKKKLVPFSAVEALEQLESMYKIYIYDPNTKNRFTKTVMLTKKQESILRAINRRLVKT